MRIVFVNGRYWPAVGGVESFLRDLARALAERHDVTVLAQRVDDAPWTRLTESVAPPPLFDAFDDDGVRVVPLRIPAPRRALLAPLALQAVPGFRRYAYGRARVPATSLYSRVVAPALERAVARADVVHVMGGGMIGDAAIRAAHAAGAAAVITPFVHRGEWGDDRASGATYRRADRVIALLDADARVYRSLGVPDTAIARIGLCSPGVDAEGAPDVRREHGIEGPLVLFLGVRRAYKGFDILREAARLVSDARGDVTFAFCGPGEPLPSTAGVRVVDRPEPVRDPERAAWLAAADVLCLPSAGEVTPLSVLEAWSVGTPALTSDIETLAELMQRSGGGVAVPRDRRAVADALLELLADPRRLRALGEAGRRHFEQHHRIDAVARAHEEVYERARRVPQERAA